MTIRRRSSVKIRDHSLAVPYWIVVLLLALNWAFDLFPQITKLF